MGRKVLAGKTSYWKFYWKPAIGQEGVGQANLNVSMHIILI